MASDGNTCATCDLCGCIARQCDPASRGADCGSHRALGHVAGATAHVGGAPHFSAEVASAVRRAVAHGRIPTEAGERALTALSSDIAGYTRVAEVSLATWRRAWGWAQKLRRSNLYDALYLAVAEEAGAQLWTTDENLVRALEADGQPAPAWVHLLTA